MPERPPAVARAARENTPRRAVVPATPEVLISQDEADALRRLFAALNQRRFETLPDLEAALRPPTPITAIEIEPITVRALDSE